MEPIDYNTQEEIVGFKEFEEYQRLGFAQARPVTDTEIADGVVGLENANISVSQADVDADSPKQGDMIARNPDNYDDQWLIAKEYWEKNFATEPSNDFGFALKQLKAGKKVARSGWNGKGMFLFLVQGSTFKVNRAPLLGIYEEGTEINYQSHIDMKTADDTIVPWLCSQSDALAEDWEVVE